MLYVCLFLKRTSSSIITYELNIFVQQEKMFYDFIAILVKKKRYILLC
jgi:hypothetical protein